MTGRTQSASSRHVNPSDRIARASIKGHRRRHRHRDAERRSRILRLRGKDGANSNQINRRVSVGRLDLSAVMSGQPDHAVVPDDFSHAHGGEVRLPDVHSVGRKKMREIGAVVHDEGDASFRAEVAESLTTPQEILVASRLLSELHDVNAALQSIPHAPEEIGIASTRVAGDQIERPPFQ